MYCLICTRNARTDVNFNPIWIYRKLHNSISIGFEVKQCSESVLKPKPYKFGTTFGSSTSSSTSRPHSQLCKKIVDFENPQSFKHQFQYRKSTEISKLCGFKIINSIVFNQILAQLMYALDPLSELALQTQAAGCPCTCNACCRQKLSLATARTTAHLIKIL